MTVWHSDDTISAHRGVSGLIRWDGHELKLRNYMYNSQIVAEILYDSVPSTQTATISAWQQAEAGGGTRGDIYFTNLTPGIYAVNYDLIYNVSGTDTSDIEWELRIGHTRIQPRVTSETTVEFSGQIIENVQSGSTAISTRITATNSSDDFTFILSDTVSSESIIRIA